jgi:hypothetical protein
VSAQADGPGRAAALDLDTLEREGGTLPVFDFVHSGKRYMLSDPQEVDWQKLILAMSNPVRFLQMVMPPEDHHEFFTAPLPTWKMNALMDAYLKHYGLPGVGEAPVLPR